MKTNARRLNRSSRVVIRSLDCKAARVQARPRRFRLCGQQPKRKDMQQIRQRSHSHKSSGRYGIAGNDKAHATSDLEIKERRKECATSKTKDNIINSCGLFMLKESRLERPFIWLLVSMWLNPLT